MQPCKVLIVDDELLILKALGEIFVRHGWQVIEASQGSSALRLYACEEDSIDLVLLDMSLPDIAGEDVARLLRKRNPGIPILLITALDEKRVLDRMSIGGFTDLLRKPFGPETLWQHVQNCLV